MSDPAKFGLFFLKSNSFFPEGSLFELRDSNVLSLPDRGDGNPAEIAKSDALPCPPFAANVPPGECPVTVTSFQMPGSAGKTENIVIDKNLHHQIIKIPLPVNPISSVTVRDRLRNFENDSYESPSVSPDNIYELHIGHLRPGFYETDIVFEAGETGRMTFIKLFPPSFTESYSDLLESESRELSAVEKGKTVAVIASPGPIRINGEFSAELLNKALELTTEWGSNFGKPIDERILATYPVLTSDEIRSLTRIAREAESFIYSLAESELEGEITETDIPIQGRQKYTWIDDQNLSRLTNIGMFYARK